MRISARKRRNREILLYVWPIHFPPSCPPVGAVNLAGTVFRFINGTLPADRDFISHYERNPAANWGTRACQARGISVVRTWADCGQMRKGIPALRKKRIAIAEISTQVGVVAPTPSGSCNGHCTWWREPTPSDVRPLFAKFDEPLKAPNE